jgi:hypothetical protein
VQAEDAVHDTAFRKLNCAPDGLGVDWMAHLVPSQCSAKVPEFEAPTAVHAEDEVQATPNRAPPPAEGFGDGTIRHCVPSQCSAKVPEFDAPTAVHAEGEVQATPNRAPPPAEGFGVGWMRHWVPFRRSARGLEAPWLLTAWPTAVHAEGDEQDALISALSLAPSGLGVGWMAHLPLSQCSARVTTTPEPLVKSPTAVQEVELAQETPMSWPVRADRFGVGAIDHPDPGPVPVTG